MRARASAPTCPWGRATGATSSASGGTVTPQGVLALVADTAASLDAVLDAAGPWLWLDGVQDPGNVGAVVRVAAAFGVAGLLVGEGTADPLGLKALRASAGLALALPFARASAADIAAACAAGAGPCGRSTPAATTCWRSPRRRPGLVLAVGAEGPGLSDAAAPRRPAGSASRSRPGVDSLNAAVAVGIAAAWLFRRAVAMSEPLEARVVRLDAKGCLVRLDEPHADLPGDGRVLWCGVRGRIHLRDRRGPEVAGRRRGPRAGRAHAGGSRRRRRRPPAPEHALAARHRQGHVEHVMAANVDQVVVVSGAAEPAFSPGLVDRILAVIEYSELEAVIVVNKMDLVDGPPDEVDTYRALGYTVLLTSARTGAASRTSAPRCGARSASPPGTAASASPRCSTSSTPAWRSTWAT